MRNYKPGWTIKEKTRQVITYYSPEQLVLVIKVNMKAKNVNTILCHDLVRKKLYRISRNPKCGSFVSDINMNSTGIWKEDPLSQKRMNIEDIKSVAYIFSSLVDLKNQNFSDLVRKMWQKAIELVTCAKNTFYATKIPNDLTKRIRQSSTRELLHCWFSNVDILVEPARTLVDKELNERGFVERRRYPFRNKIQLNLPFTPT